jgi:hypothetical protein
MSHMLLVIFGGLLIPLRRVSILIVISIVILLIGYAVFYADTSWDYEGYLNYFECARLGNCYGDDFGVEFSFIAAAKIFGIIFGSAGGMILVALYTSLSVTLKLNLLREECQAFGVALFGYLCLSWFLHEMTQIRIGLAIAFLWFAVRSQSKNSAWKAVIYFGLAIIIHYSAALAIVYVAFRSAVVTMKIWVVWLVITALVGAALSNYATQFVDLAAIFIDPRFAIYAGALGSEILTTSQLNVHSAIAIAFVTLCVAHGLHSWTAFEIAALKFVILGTMFYMLFFWLPIIGLRGFELFTSFLPIVGAACYRAHRSRLTRLLILIMFFGLFLNAVVRNGLMLDFVFPWQAQEILLDSR